MQTLEGKDRGTQNECQSSELCTKGCECFSVTLRKLVKHT